MIAIYLLAVFYLSVYLFEIARLSWGFGQIKDFVSDAAPDTTKFSIIIPFRNEEQRLPGFLESVSRLNYLTDAFELIFINDASTDASEKIIYAWRMQHGHVDVTLIENVQMTPSPKKNAILRAIPIAKNDWVITTDADCLLPKNWLQEFNALINNNNRTTLAMIAAPVAFEKASGFLAHFQRLDFLSLQGTTIGSFGIGRPFMCNGANFAYQKAFFHEIGGFSGNEKMASGDDVFLLQKAVRQFPDRVVYLKSQEAIVKTFTEKSWVGLIRQRVRWAAKAASYQDVYGKNLSVTVLLANVTLLALAILYGIGLADWRFVCVYFLLKLLFDWLLLHRANRFFYGKGFVFPILSSVFYPIFTLVVGINAIFGKYTWKGRKFKV